MHHNIYLFGDTPLNQSLYSGLIRRFSGDVFIVKSQDPEQARRTMARLECRYSKAIGILDYSSEIAHVSKKGVRFSNCIRADEELEWDGSLIVLVENSKIQHELSAASMNGNDMPEEIASFANGPDTGAAQKILLVSPLLITAIMETLRSVKPLKNFQWKTIQNSGAVSRALGILERAENLDAGDRKEIINEFKRIHWQSIDIIHNKIPADFEARRTALLKNTKSDTDFFKEAKSIIHMACLAIGTRRSE